MSKFIDMDKLVLPKGIVDEIREKGVPVILDWLAEQESIEIVRCKDCKHRGESNDGYPMCMLFQKTKVFVELNHYCSRGERKEIE